MTELVNFIFHTMKISIFRHKLAFKQVVRFLKSFSILWEKCCYHSSAFIFGWIFFILAGNMPIHKSLDELEFREDFFSNFGVSCPWASEKSMNNIVTTLVASFLIGSPFSLQIRTTIKALMSLSFVKIPFWS